VPGPPGARRSDVICPADPPVGRRRGFSPRRRVRFPSRGGAGRARL